MKKVFDIFIANNDAMKKRKSYTVKTTKEFFESCSCDKLERQFCKMCDGSGLTSVYKEEDTKIERI